MSTTEVMLSRRGRALGCGVAGHQTLGDEGPFNMVTPKKLQGNTFGTSWKFKWADLACVHRHRRTCCCNFCQRWTKLKQQYWSCEIKSWRQVSGVFSHFKCLKTTVSCHVTQGPASLYIPSIYSRLDSSPPAVELISRSITFFFL